MKQLKYLEGEEESKIMGEVATISVDVEELEADEGNILVCILEKILLAPC